MGKNRLSKSLMTVKLNSIGTRVSVTVAFVLCFYVLLSFFTKSLCLSRSLFGLPCPGCGLTRAWISAFSLRWSDAFLYHPLFFLVPILIAIYLSERFYFKQVSIKSIKYFYLSLLFLFLAVYVMRMFLLFPHSAPMQINFNSFLMRIIQAFTNYSISTQALKPPP